MKLLINILLALWLLMMLASCHDPINRVNKCGRVSYITDDYYEVSIAYTDSSTLPSSVRLRFTTTRPDTIVFNSTICLQ